MASTYINHDVNGRSPHKNFKSNTITSACYSGIRSVSLETPLIVRFGGFRGK